MMVVAFAMDTDTRRRARRHEAVMMIIFLLRKLKRLSVTFVWVFWNDTCD
jgi:hypothetical protein